MSDDSMRTAFRSVGRSGLVVSPFALGTMTFGRDRWGSPDDVSEAIFNAYVDHGGNFVDTAEAYANGRSEELLGAFIAARSLRDRIVLATKFGWQAGSEPDANAGGNGRKNIHRALEASLRRLKTDYVDLYWLHVWDRVTPVEEVLQTFGDLVRAGRIRYFGFSNAPAWYVAKAATLAQAHGVPGPIALQLEYSLVERAIEREYVPAAKEFGLGIAPWSPLGAGFLAGKYRRSDGGAAGDGRLAGPNPFGDRKFTEPNWRTLEALREVAVQVDRPLSQVALAWVLAQPGVTAPLIGAKTVEQLEDNLASVGVELSTAQLEQLDARSAPEPSYPYGMFTDGIGAGIFGGRTVAGVR